MPNNIGPERSGFSKNSSSKVFNNNTLNTLLLIINGFVISRSKSLTKFEPSIKGGSPSSFKDEKPC